MLYTPKGLLRHLKIVDDGCGRIYWEKTPIETRYPQITIGRITCII